MLFTDTITIYNYDNGTWNRHVIDNVQWRKASRNLTVSGQIEAQAVNVSLTFNMEANRGNLKYYSPIEYHKLQDKTNAWTLDESTGQDVVVLGVVGKEITTNYRIKHLREEYQDIAIVRSVSDNRNRTYLKNIKAVAE